MAQAELAIRSRYSLSLVDLAGRHFDVTHRLEDLDGVRAQLEMPNWVPGSYMIREFASHVGTVRAFDGDRELHCEKTSKSSWTVHLDGATSCELRYQVFAGEQSVRTSYIAHDQAFINPAGVFFRPVERADEPLLVELALPRGWQAFSALRRGKDALQFVADDYDQLVDSPIQTGPLVAHPFDVDGTPHEFLVVGSGNIDVQRVLEDSAKICAHEKEMFGELPMERYLFILLLTEKSGGGLEHCDSSVLAWPKLKFRPEKEYRKFLTLVAHEYFHLWNVKRMRPAVFERYDYQNEVYTRLLWVFEGITSYYDQLVPLRAGCYGAKDYLELLAERIVGESSREGRHSQSIAESSFDTWIKLYRPTPDSYNSQVSYYERGELVALLLDLHLRATTENQKSLDDVMRAMYHGMFKEGKLLREDGFAELVRSATGVDVADMLEELVHGTGPLELRDALAGVGLDLTADIEKDEKIVAWLGAAIDNGGGTSVLGHVRVGGSAHAGGMMSGDEIVALDEHRIYGDLAERLKLYKTGEKARWSAFRDRRLVQGEIEFLPDPNPKQKFVQAEGVGDRAREAYRSWLGVELEATFAVPENGD